MKNIFSRYIENLGDMGVLLVLFSGWHYLFDIDLTKQMVLVDGVVALFFAIVGYLLLKLHTVLTK